MLMHGKYLTFCLISLTKLVWCSVHAGAIFLSLLYKGSQITLRPLK